MHCKAIHYTIIQYNTTQLKTRQSNPIQNNALQYNTIQYKTMHYSTIQYNTRQCGAYQRQGLPICYLQRTIPRQRRAPKNLLELLCPVQYIHQRYVQNINKTNRVSSSEFFQPIEF